MILSRCYYKSSIFFNFFLFLYFQHCGQHQFFCGMVHATSLVLFLGKILLLQPLPLHVIILCNGGLANQLITPVLKHVVDLSCLYQSKIVFKVSIIIVLQLQKFLPCRACVHKYFQISLPENYQKISTQKRFLYKALAIYH